MRVFYGLYPADPKLQLWLNLVRFLANPEQKLIAHLTVRGPYRQRYALTSATAAIRGHCLQITGVDAFLNPGQATAILRCGPDETLRRIWHKPDYPGFNPHISICDGLTEIVTKKILTVCEPIRPFRFVSTALLPIVTKPAQAELSLIRSVDFGLLGQILGDVLDAEKVRQAEVSTRLAWLGKIVLSQPL